MLKQHFEFYILLRSVVLFFYFLAFGTTSIPCEYYVDVNEHEQMGIPAAYLINQTVHQVTGCFVSTQMKR